MNRSAGQAIKMLVSNGMLEVRPRTGTRVLDTRHWQLLDREVLLWHRSVDVEPERFAQLMEFRQSIEPDAIEACAYDAMKLHLADASRRLSRALVSQGGPGSG